MGAFRSLWSAIAVLSTASMVPAALAGGGDEEGVPMATPMGVTIQVPIGRGFGFINAYKLPRAGIQYYADAKGMALYTYDLDRSNESLCYEDCARTWPPLLAPRNARAFGDWSVVKRRDGRRQWAHLGKPLYRFSADSVIGETKGVPEPGDSQDKDKGKDQNQSKNKSADTGTDGKSGKQSDPQAADGVNPSTAAGADTQTPSPWRLAVYQLTKLTTPNSVDVQEVTDAGGEALVTGGMTLYSFEGIPGRDDQACGTPPCIGPWAPLQAGRLANPIGDFTIIERQDGIRQWAYRNKALYTFKHDRTAGDAKGVGADKRWRAALVKRFYMPPNVTIRESLGQGKVIATADGMTLYRRTALRGGVAGILPRDLALYPELGRVFGTRSCDAECLKSWIPFAAPARAQPSGFWEVMTRENGKKQWSYKGHALYQYRGDKLPGDVMGDSNYDVVTNYDIDPQPDALAAVATDIKTENQVILVWSHSYP